MPNVPQFLATIKRMNPTKAVGPDKMSILHWSAIPEVAIAIIKACATKGGFSKAMNQSRTITLHKKGKVRDPNNFRVIAVTNSLIKIYEKFLYRFFKR